jgi:hypothetical protein
VLDLLDRFGGELGYGKLHCRIRRKKKRLPVFIVKEVSEGTAKSLGGVYQHQYEHYVKSGKWLILGKDIPDMDLIGIVIRKEESMVRFIGFLDKGTADILFSRMAEGVPPEVALMLE